MNPRVTTITIGVLTLAFGLAGLLYPDRVMGLLGFTVLNASHAAAAYGEIRAVYGGLFTVLGAFVIFAGIDPARNRALIFFVGLLYLGVCGGRLVGAYVDGSPGVPGWVTAAFELIVGGALVGASWLARPAAEPVSPPYVSPQPAPASAPPPQS